MYEMHWKREQRQKAWTIIAIAWITSLRCEHHDESVKVGRSAGAALQLMTNYNNYLKQPLVLLLNQQSN